MGQRLNNAKALYCPKATPGGADIAIIDLFRVADGRIIEHWDVIEEIGPEDTWVNRGKF